MPVVLFLWGLGQTKGNSLCLRACPCWPAAEGAVQVCLHLRSNLTHSKLTHSRGEKLETVWMDRLRTTWSYPRVLWGIHKGDQCPVPRYVYTLLIASSPAEASLCRLAPGCPPCPPRWPKAKILGRALFPKTRSLPPNLSIAVLVHLTEPELDLAFLQIPNYLCFLSISTVWHQKH